MTFDNDDENNPNGNNTAKEVSTVRSSTSLKPALGGLAGYVAEVSAGEIAGTILKFVKGDFFAGKENVPVPLGTRLVVNLDLLSIGYLCWKGGKVVDARMGFVSQNFRPPPRHQLGDNDSEMWELDDQGVPRDPWQYTVRIQLADPETGEVSTFSASSTGSRGAIDKLCKAYLVAQPRHPAEWPIIVLGVDSYQHSNKAYGRIKFPTFKIVGWLGKDAVSAEPEPKPTLIGNPLGEEDVPPPSGPDDYGFDDDDR
jgi:hypothetical protein